MEKEAQEAGHETEVAVNMFKFAKEGDTILGIIKSSREVKTPGKDETYTVYAMETDEGMIQFAAGVSLTNTVNDCELYNKLIRITFIGQENTRGGNRVNQYKVVDYSGNADSKTVEPF